MRVRQVLTVAALAGLQFAPMPIAFSVRSSFSDTVWAPAGPRAAGSAVPAIAAAARNGIDVAPKVVQPAQTGDVVGVRLQNAGSTTETAGYITFGQVFLAGAVKPTDSLVARINSINYTVQMDSKATHADGSVRHAVLTLHAPAIAAGRSVDLMLAKGTAAAPSPAAPSASALLASGYNTTVNFTFHNPDGTTTTGSGSAAAVQAAQSAGSVQNWLIGLEVNEFDVVTTVDGGKLKVEFDIRAYADGTTTTDVIFDNSWMFSPGKTDLKYDVSISHGGKQVFSASSVGQYLYSMWHHEVDSAGTISPNIQFDVPYLQAAGALPNYDLTLGVSDAAIQENYNGLNATNTGPMGTAEVVTHMPDAGGRPDIGPHPNWTAQWLLSQNATARTVMMANADASGSVPWHFTDENTGKPVNRETYKTFMDLPGLLASDGYLVPTNGWPTYESAADPWSPDAAHMPDLTYVPYLITGNHYQFEQVQAQGAFAIFQANPYYEYYTNGVPVDPNNPGNALYAGQAVGETRGVAWTIRQVAEAAYITPDSDPLKSYFTSQLNATMIGLVQHYITDGAGAPFGQIQGFILGGETASSEAIIVAPWQQGYIVTALAAVAKMNIPQASAKAVQMLGYMTNFVAGLYTNGSNGYNPFNGPAYWLYVNDPTTLAPYTSWAELQTKNVVDHTLNSADFGIPEANPTSFPESAMDMDSGYPIIARAALADLITYTQSPQAIQAYDYVVSQIVSVWSTNGGSQAEIAAWQVNPEWNVMPRLQKRTRKQSSG